MKAGVFLPRNLRKPRSRARKWFVKRGLRDVQTKIIALRPASDLSTFRYESGLVSNVDLLIMAKSSNRSRWVFENRDGRFRGFRGDKNVLVM